MPKEQPRLDERLLAEAQNLIAAGDAATANELLKEAERIQAAAEKNAKRDT